MTRARQVLIVFRHELFSGAAVVAGVRAELGLANRGQHGMGGPNPVPAASSFQPQTELDPVEISPQTKYAGVEIEAVRWADRNQSRTSRGRQGEQPAAVISLCASSSDRSGVWDGQLM